MVEALTLVPPAFVVLAAAILSVVLPRNVGHALGAIATGAVLAIALLVPEGEHLATSFLGFDAVLFHVDAFSRLMGLIFGIIGTAAVVYSFASEASRTQTAFGLLYVGSSVGAVFAGDWLVLVFYWELMAVTSTLLVWHHGGEAVRAGFRYAVAHGIGGNLLLFAIVWHYAETGTMLYVDAGIAPGAPALLAALGIGVNVAFVGLHTWLPDTYPSPHVASSVFLSVFTTKTGVYVLYRAFPDGALALAYMGGLMAVYGVVYALLQHDMRRLLSYHIQAQVGYMVAGIGIGTAFATAGAMAHVYNHILYKALLFMAVGVIIYRTGREDLYELGGLWREMPITAIAFVIGALSISAFPGFNGFVSKGMVVDAAHEEHLTPLVWLLLAGGVGTFLSFIKLGYYAFLHGESDIEVRDATRGQSIAMLSIAGLCVLYGLVPDLLFSILPLADQWETTPYSTGHIYESLQLAAAAVIGFVIIKRPLSRLGKVPDIDAIINPAAFYSGRVTMRAVTETYAAVDAVTVALVRRCYWIGNNPALAVDQVARRLPSWLVETEKRRPADGGTPSTLHLRAGIGTTILIVTLMLTLVVWLVL